MTHAPDKPKTDTFTKDKWELLDAIYDDPDISSVEFEVAYGLIKHLNRRKGCSWPGIKLLADAIQGKEAVITGKGVEGTGKTVRRALDKLVAKEYFYRVKGGGGERTRYYPPWNKPDIKAKKRAVRPDTTVPSAQNVRPDIAVHQTGHLKNGRPDTHVRSDDDENDAIIYDDQYDSENFGDRDFDETEKDNPMMNPLRAETIVSAQPYEVSTPLQAPIVVESGTESRAVEDAALSSTSAHQEPSPASTDEECVAAALKAAGLDGQKPWTRLVQNYLDFCLAFGNPRHDKPGRAWREYIACLDSMPHQTIMDAVGIWHEQRKDKPKPEITADDITAGVWLCLLRHGSLRPAVAAFITASLAPARAGSNGAALHSATPAPYAAPHTDDSDDNEVPL